MRSPSEIKVKHATKGEVTLEKVLKTHKLWLDTDGKEGERADLRWVDLRCANLQEANLQEADLRFANLQEADLRCANLQRADLQKADLREADLDYSCWPLWCGSLGVKADEALVGQLLFHVADLAKSSGVEMPLTDRQKELINKGSPVTKHGKELKE